MATKILYRPAMVLRISLYWIEPIVLLTLRVNPNGPSVSIHAIAILWYHLAVSDSGIKHS